VKGNAVYVENRHHTVSKIPLWNTVTSKCRIPWLPFTVVTVYHGYRSFGTEHKVTYWFHWTGLVAQVTRSQLVTTANRPRSVPRPTSVIRDWSARPPAASWQRQANRLGVLWVNLSAAVSFAHCCSPATAVSLSCKAGRRLVGLWRSAMRATQTVWSSLSHLEEATLHPGVFKRLRALVVVCFSDCSDEGGSVGPVPWFRSL